MRRNTSSSWGCPVSEEELVWDIYFDPLTEHYKAIGSLCATWAVIDRTLDELIAALLPASQDRVACITTTITDVAPRCEIIVRLITLDHPHPAFRDWLIALVRRVSGEIAPLRNRYVHDAWQLEEGQLVRFDRRAKVAKVQARHPPTLIFDTKHLTDVKEVSRLEECARFVMAGLAFAKLDLNRWRRTGDGREPPPEWLPMSMPRSRFLTFQEHQEAVAQGKTPGRYVVDP